MSSCSVASLVGSAPGCEKPQLVKVALDQWVCNNCGETFTVHLATKRTTTGK